MPPKEAILFVRRIQEIPTKEAGVELKIPPKELIQMSKDGIRAREAIAFVRKMQIEKKYLSENRTSTAKVA